MFSWLTKWFKGPEFAIPNCGHWAILAAKVWLNLKGNDVRIAHGMMLKRKTWYPHAQAQTNIKGKWQWLEVINGRVEVGRMTAGFEPDTFFELNEFWERWRDYA